MFYHQNSPLLLILLPTCVKLRNSIHICDLRIWFVWGNIFITHFIISTMSLNLMSASYFILCCVEKNEYILKSLAFVIQTNGKKRMLNSPWVCEEFGFCCWCLSHFLERERAILWGRCHRCVNTVKNMYPNLFCSILKMYSV